MRIFCFGDSNTYGYDPRSYFGDRYGAQERWVDLVAAQTGLTTVNLGMNGQEIPRYFSFPRLFPEYTPGDAVLVMLGTNDLLQGASAQAAAARMEVFLESLMLHCGNILLIAPPPMKRGAWVPTDALAEASCLLSEEYRELAHRLGIRFLDTRSWDIALTFDGVHFTEEGHRSFARQLSEYLKGADFLPVFTA